MAAIVELWSKSDQQRLQRFIQAVAANDALATILALNAADVDPIRQAIDKIKPRVQEADALGGLLGVASTIGSAMEDDWGITLNPDHPLIHECDLRHCWDAKSASPRTLAALWVYVIQELGYDAHWLEMSVFHPVAIRDEHSRMMIDSTSGRMVSKADCKDIFEAIVDDEMFDPDMFFPPNAQEIAVDILELRLAGAASNDDHVATYQHMRFHAALHQDDPQIVFAAAMAAASIGDFGFATSTLNDLLERTEDGDLRTAIARALERIENQSPYMN